MKTQRKTNVGVGLGVLVLLGGCGLERLVIEDLGGTARVIPPPPGNTVISGQHGLTGSVSISPTLADGSPIPGAVTSVTGPTYTVKLPDTEYPGVLITAQSGAVVLQRLVPNVAPRANVTGMDLSTDTTTVAIAAAAALGAHNANASTIRGVGVAKIVTALGKLTGGTEALAALSAAVGRVVSAAQPGGTLASLGVPTVDPGYAVTRSAVNADWLATVSVDLDGDGTPDSTSAPFDSIVAAAAKAVQSPDGTTSGVCLDPDYVRTIFMVNFNAGQKDGNCSTISRFKWVKDEPGKSMFFTGGIHKESTIQDSAIQAEMGNWIPNIVRMYDDGTHGDEKAGDNIWTVTFDLPRGLRTAYKYEWGKQGLSWTGTEEWPGNQRLLAIVDLNHDGFVYRYDNFGDEASNKDKVNAFNNGPGMVDWTTDANNNGIPDADENPVDLTNSCGPGTWVTPTWIGPLISYCGQ